MYGTQTEDASKHASCLKVGEQLGVEAKVTFIEVLKSHTAGDFQLTQLLEDLNARLATSPSLTAVGGYYCTDRTATEAGEDYQRPVGRAYRRMPILPGHGELRAAIGQHLAISRSC
jgi:hypothetical protein